MLLPLVSCLLPTYNRFPRHGHLVAESVESFCRQDYPNKELLLCNDTPGQELICNAPQVRVFNVPRRFPRLADKLRWLIDQAAGDLFCRWDDDDISLPWRLALSVEKLGDRLEWHPANYWYCPPTGPQEDRRHGNDHIQAIWRRELLDAIGGYPASPWSGHEDQDFHAVLNRHGLLDHAPEVLPAEQIYYLYRWGASPTHLSGTGGGAQMQTYYQRLGQQPITPGVFTVHPHWRQDYVALTRAALPPESPSR